MISNGTADQGSTASSRPLRARCLGGLWSFLLRLLAATWSVRLEGVDAFDEALAADCKLLAVFWHGKYAALFPLMRGRRALVFASTSRRGDVLAEICRRFGYSCVQIPDHGGERSLDLMRSSLAGETAGAVAADGPTGPYEVVKRGIVTLAAEQHRLIFPASVAASRKRVFAGRWDRREIPRSFSRVALVIGEPLRIPSRLSAGDEDRWRKRIQQALRQVDLRARGRISHPPCD